MRNKNQYTQSPKNGIEFMPASLSINDLDFILDSLSYTKLKFQEYTKYPSYEFKLQRIEEVNSLIKKIRKIKKELKA